jgi:hypothetical protein
VQEDGPHDHGDGQHEGQEDEVQSPEARVLSARC